MNRSHISSANDSSLSAPSMDQKPSYSTSFVAIKSPPTPSPSPRPTKSRCPESAVLRDVRLQFQALDTHSRNQFLSDLLSCCDVESLLHVSNIITPRIKRDFLKELPIELSLHIISFIPDPQTLARAASVSKFWNGLLADEFLWKTMCKIHKYCCVEDMPGVCGSPRARVVRRLSLASSDENARSRADRGAMIRDEESHSTMGVDDLDDPEPDFSSAASPEDGLLRSSISPRTLVECMRSLCNTKASASQSSSASLAPAPTETRLQRPRAKSAASPFEEEERRASMSMPIPPPLSYRQHFKMSYLTGAGPFHTKIYPAVIHVSFPCLWSRMLHIIFRYLFLRC
jgi:hypothetical protein